MSNDTSIIANARTVINTSLSTVTMAVSTTSKLVQSVDILADVAVSAAEHVRDMHTITRLESRAALSKAECEMLGVDYTPPKTAPVRKPRAKKQAA